MTPPAKPRARPITVFGGRRNNYEARARHFNAGGVSVALSPATNEYDNNEAAFAEVCDAMFDALTGAEAALAAAKAEASEQAELAARRAVEIANLHAQIPKEPRALLGVGCVRWIGDEMWALNKRETGWASSGYRIEGWDELFRRWRAVVLDVGTDEHGPYVLFGPAGRQ